MTSIIQHADRRTVKVVHGAASERLCAAGQPAAALLLSLADALNVPADAWAFVNGKVVPPRYRVRPGDVLEFVVPQGRKGGGDDRDEFFLRSNDPMLKLNEIIFRLGRLEAMVEEALKQHAPVKESYTVEEFARLVDKAPYTIREHCRSGRLRAEKAACGRGLSEEWRIPHAELVRYRNEGLLRPEHRR